MSDYDPGYTIGDLVQCHYDLYDWATYTFDLDDDSPRYPFYGIIVAIQDDFYDDQFGYEKLYIVRCTDGHERFFAYWEMKLISTSS